MGFRFGDLKVQEESFARTCMQVSQEIDFSAKLIKDEYTKGLKSDPTSLRLRASRQRPLSSDGIKLRQCDLGELCWLATLSRLDFCARSARFATRVDLSLGSDIYRINDPTRPAKERQRATVLKYASSPRPGAPARGDLHNRVRARREDIHRGTISVVGSSNAGYGDRRAGGQCPLVYAIGLTSSTFRVPCRILQRPP